MHKFGGKNYKLTCTMDHTTNKTTYGREGYDQEKTP